MATDGAKYSKSENEATGYERGFKSWCENTAVSLRKKLGLSPIAPLSPYFLAEKMGILVWDFDQIPNLKSDTAAYLSSAEGDEWSAVTVIFNEKNVIVTNPRHSDARKSSDLMHELAHMLRGHKPGQLVITEEFALRQFDEIQEAEADWFAGSLLLPRVALATSVYKGIQADDVMNKYGVSADLYRYRSNKLGINKQFKYISRKNI